MKYYRHCDHLEKAYESVHADRVAYLLSLDKNMTGILYRS